jgi:16S rRNA (cytidine1402-2'-O)-methyltransferase
MPAVWDPGQRLIERMLMEGIAVCPIGASSSAIAAIAVSGLASEGFIFLGALSSGRRASAILDESANAPHPVVLLVSGGRLRSFLKTLAARIPSRQVVIAADLGTAREQVHRATAKAIGSKVRGGVREATVVIDRKGRLSVSE